MDVRDSTGIRNWLNRAKVVFAFTVGEEPAVALEVSVSFFGAGRSRVQVDAAVVDLPDFNKRTGDGRASGR